jgi:hypothetical protein
MITYYNRSRRGLRLHEKGGKEHEMPVHHLLEQILNEYIVAANLQSGQTLFQRVNTLGTTLTGRALNRYNAWAAIRKGRQGGGFSGSRPAGNRHHNLAGERRTVLARVNRWLAMSLHEQRSSMTRQGRDHT